MDLLALMTIKRNIFVMIHGDRGEEENEEEKTIRVPGHSLVHQYILPWVST